MAGAPLDPVWRSEVDKISHRHYYQGFYYGQPQQGQFYEDARYIRDWDVAVSYTHLVDAINSVLDTMTADDFNNIMAEAI